MRLKSAQHPREIFFAVIERKGAASLDIIPELVATVLEEFSWPKSMRWGEVGPAGCVPKPDHRPFDGAPVAGEFDLGGGLSIPFGDKTEGHRMLAPEEIKIRSGKSYAADLEKAFVIVDRKERIERIRQSIMKLAEKENLKWREDEGLLAEVAGLVEFPHLIMGQIGQDVMDLPTEVLIVAMRNHQKYFAFDQLDGAGLAPCFATVTNMSPDPVRDKVIRNGNERVLAARLSDARFFWNQDRQALLDQRLPQLDEITFLKVLAAWAGKPKDWKTCLRHSLANRSR